MTGQIAAVLTRNKRV